MTIAQLESLLNNRRTHLNDLMRERKKAQTRLDNFDRQIAQLNGRGFSGGARVKNPASLVKTMEDILRENGKPMQVGDIVAAVNKTGYRSNSANFRGIVNQTLIKEKQFSSAARGLYQLKK